MKAPSDLQLSDDAKGYIQEIEILAGKQVVIERDPMAPSDHGESYCTKEGTYLVRINPIANEEMVIHEVGHLELVAKNFPSIRITLHNENERPLFTKVNAFLVSGILDSLVEQQLRDRGFDRSQASDRAVQTFMQEFKAARPEEVSELGGWAAAIRFWLAVSVAPLREREFLDYLRPRMPEWVIDICQQQRERYLEIKTPDDYKKFVMKVATASCIDDRVNFVPGDTPPT